jgi:hypothetical protein
VKLIDLIFNFLPEWCFLYKSPMSFRYWQIWGRIRKWGSIAFVVLVTCCLGSFAFGIDLLWDVTVQHQMAGLVDREVMALYWFSGAFIVGVVEWLINENRYRLPPKAASETGWNSQ